MKPIKFKEVNKIFAKDQKQYKELPAYKASTDKGEVITCWSLTFCERLRVLFTGRIWLMLLTFNKSLSPSNMTTKKGDFLFTEEEIEKAGK